MAEPIADPELKFIEEQLAPMGGMFGESIVYMTWVDATSALKSKTFNKRILVIGRFRILLVKKGKFGRSVENNVHLYNIVDVSALEADEKMEIKYYNDVEKQAAEGGMVIKAPSKQIMSHIIKAMRTSYRAVTVGFPDKYLLKFNVTTDRLEPLDGGFVVSQANGLIDQYIALSHYYKTKITLDYVRWIEALVQNRAIDLDFTECPGIDPTSELTFNLFTAIVSLRHNTYFRSIRAVKLPHINIVNAVGMVLETNTTVTRVVLKDLKTEQSLMPIGRALGANPDNALVNLTLSGNTIGAQSLVALCDGFEKLTHGLTRLDLSRSGIRPKGIEILFNSFERNFGMSLALEHLDLSDNNFSETGSIALAGWISKAKGYNNLRSLALSNCNLNFGIMGPPLRVMDLRDLDLSRNRIDKNAAKLVADVLECVPTLKNVNLSQCRLGWEAAEYMFQGLARNKPLIAKTGVLTFNLKDNQLGPRGGLMVARALPQLSYLGTLNLANNRIGAKALTEFAMALNTNKWIASLDISGNITGAANTEIFCIHMKDYIATHPNLKSLSIAGTPKFGLAKALLPIIEGLANNSTLTYLNISENNIGDLGASVLAECLRTNKGLTTVITNANHFSFTGWTTLVAPILYRTNTTLCNLPTPLTLHTPPNSAAEPFSSYSGETKDQLMDLFSRLHYRLLGNNPTPPKTLREPPRPIPTQVERAADVPEHLLLMAPPKTSTAGLNMAYSPTTQRLHEVTETGNIGGPTSKEDWAADESWGDEHPDGVSVSEANESGDEFEDDDDSSGVSQPKLERKSTKNFDRPAPASVPSTPNPFSPSPTPNPFASPAAPPPNPFAPPSPAPSPTTYKNPFTEEEEEERKEDEAKEKKEKEEKDRREREEQERKEQERKEQDRKDQDKKDREEQERKDREKREREDEDRKEQERRDQERKDQERKDQERKDQERKEQDRREKEEKERKEAEKKEQDRRDQERKDQERRDREERERKEQEKRDQERREQDRKEQERRDRERREEEERERSKQRSANPFEQEENDDLT